MPKMLERAERMPECFGMSVKFKGGGEKKGLKKFARAEKLISVDCLTQPAANTEGLIRLFAFRARTSAHLHLPVPSLEPLEARIAPASVFTFLDRHHLSYTEADGDVVLLAITRGDIHEISFATQLDPNQIDGFSFDTRGFRGTDVSFTVSAAGPAGDGLVNLELIDGGTFGRVSIAGNLGTILASSIRSLHVGSLGEPEHDTLGNGFISVVDHTLGRLQITGDLDGAHLEIGYLGSAEIGGSLTGTLLPHRAGSIHIVGDLVGQDFIDSGCILSDGRIGRISIDGSVRGGSSSYSGNIDVSHAGDVRIGHDLAGGTGQYSGLILSGELSGRVSILRSRYDRISIGGDIIGGPIYRSGGIAFDPYLAAKGSAGIITIGGSVRGGGGALAGSITSAAGLGVVHIHGDLIGGSGGNTGEVYAKHCGALIIDGSLRGGSGQSAQGTGGAYFDDTLGRLHIGHDLLGGSLGSGDDTLVSSGFVIAHRIGSVFVGGDVRAGQDDSARGSLIQNAEILSYSSIGPVRIHGDFSGSVGTGGDVTRAGLIGLGLNKVAPGSTRDVVISSVEIGGDLRLARILGGYSGGQNPPGAFDPDAQIGHVTVGGDWIASDVLAGVTTLYENGTQYVPITGYFTVNHPGVIASIGEITIKGRMRSDPDAPGINFGIAAEKILGLSLTGHRERFTPAYDPVIFPPVASGQAAIAEVHG
ncbi:MAG: hypothetical protein QOE70_3406 [Chthoniobacter sp.]|jgi:hypothetical protein|nr:hypothetical protein [Chthoniobacter sp.]